MMETDVLYFHRICVAYKMIQLANDKYILLFEPMRHTVIPKFSFDANTIMEQ